MSNHIRVEAFKLTGPLRTKLILGVCAYLLFWIAFAFGFFFIYQRSGAFIWKAISAFGFIWIPLPLIYPLVLRLTKKSAIQINTLTERLLRSLLEKDEVTLRTLLSPTLIQQQPQLVEGLLNQFADFPAAGYTFTATQTVWNIHTTEIPKSGQAEAAYSVQVTATDDGQVVGEPILLKLHAFFEQSAWRIVGISIKYSSNETP